MFIPVQESLKDLNDKHLFSAFGAGSIDHAEAADC